MSDEELPEPDRVEGAPHPRKTHQVFGHDAAEAEFLNAYNGERMHHAWLITGPKGVGKATLAWRIARFLLAEAPADAGLFGETPRPESLDVPEGHPVAQRIAALSEPGCMLIRRAWDPDRKRLKAQITVDEVRRLNGFFGLSSTEGGRRLVIVDSADEMNPSAANALLKVLEEPPKRSILMLISHQPARLLPTIRSRCRTLRLTGLAPDALDAALAAAGGEPGGPALSELAQGSVGEALRLQALGGLALYADIVTLIATAPRMDRQALATLAEAAAARGAEEPLALTVRLLDVVLTRLARAASGHLPGAEAADGEQDMLKRLASVPGGGATWAELQQEISARLAHGLAVNIDPASLVTDAFLKINAAV